MKIILSPSKTQKPDYNKHFEDKEQLYPSKHKKVLALLRKQPKTMIGKVMKIKGDLLNHTFSNIKNFNKNNVFQAFYSFNGLVFKNLDKQAYREEELAYIETHVRILDAFYGVLEPGTLIKPYRLDMKTTFGLNLYNHWDIDDYFKKELVLNLASDEFSKLLNTPLVSVSFLQNKDGKFINQATYSKMARGMMLDYLIKNKVTNIDDIKQFDKDSYTYNSELSNESLLIFTR